MRKETKSIPNQQQVEFIKANLYMPNRELISNLNKMGDEFSNVLLNLYKRKLRPVYSQEIMDSVLQLYKSGSSVSEISKKLNIPQKDVISIFSKNRKSKKEVEKQVNFCKENFATMTAQQMAKALEVPLSTITSILSKYKIYGKKRKLTDKELEYILQSVKDGRNINSIQKELGFKNLYYLIAKFNMYQKIRTNQPNKQVT